MVVTDGLFRDTGTFYVMRKVDLKPWEDIFKATIFKMLKKEEKINDALFNKLEDIGTNLSCPCFNDALN